MHFLDFITAIIQVLHASTLGTAGEILVRISKYLNSSLMYFKPNVQCETRKHENKRVHEVVQ